MMRNEESRIQAAIEKLSEVQKRCSQRTLSEGQLVAKLAVGPITSNIKGDRAMYNVYWVSDDKQSSMDMNEYQTKEEAEADLPYLWMELEANGHDLTGYMEISKEDQDGWVIWCKFYPYEDMPDKDDPRWKS